MKPTSRQIKEYLRKKDTGFTVVNPGDALPLIQFSNNREDPGPDPRIQISKRYCTLYYQYPYAIEMSRITTPDQLLSWVLHLASKSWMTTEYLAEFIERVAGFRGWKIHQLT